MEKSLSYRRAQSTRPTFGEKSKNQSSSHDERYSRPERLDQTGFQVGIAEQFRIHQGFILRSFKMFFPEVSTERRFDLRYDCL
jgi:hypothetical protein